MWVFLNDAFFSIIRPKDNDTKLLVRARFKGDINRIFPNAVESFTEHKDYAFRALIEESEVSEAIARNVQEINYYNFKDSVEEDWRHDTYADVWTVMWREQHRRLPVKA